MGTHTKPYIKKYATSKSGCNKEPQSKEKEKKHYCTNTTDINYKFIIHH
jgi:hypothetical protein